MIESVSTEYSETDAPGEGAANRARAFLIRRTRRVAVALLVTAISSGVALSIVG